MKKALLILLCLALLGGVIAQTTRQSARLHGAEELMDGIRFIRIRSAEVWGNVPLPTSLPDVTAEALAADVFPRNWPEGRPPLGSGAQIGRMRAGEAEIGPAHISLTLFGIPADVCALLLPKVREDVAQRTVLAFWIAEARGSEATTCPPDVPVTLRLALATRAPPNAPRAVKAD